MRTARGIYPELHHHKLHIYRPHSLAGGDGGVIFDSVDRLARVLVVDSASSHTAAGESQSDLKPGTNPPRSVPAAAFARPRQCNPGSCKLRAAQRPAAQRRNRDKSLSLELRLHHPWPERAVSAAGRRARDHGPYNVSRATPRRHPKASLTGVSEAEVPLEPRE